jgi:malonate decarboxylase alpha subunit
MVGYYDSECFVNAALQIDRNGNSSTAIRGRHSGFDGAPNLGSNAPGRRHVTPAWLKAGKESMHYANSNGRILRGKKIVVQLTPNCERKKGDTGLRGGIGCRKIGQ